MVKLLENKLTTLKVNESLKCVDIFDWVAWSKKILVNENIDFTYLVLVKDSNLDIEISTVWDWARLNVFAIFVGSKKTIKCKFITSINNSSVMVEKYILSLLGEWSNVDVDARINIWKWIEKVQWNLLEENVILWKKVSIKTLPILNVSSKDVSASHWAKIEKISSDKLFYMNSKWLDKNFSQKLVIDWYVNHVLSSFSECDDKEINMIKKFIKI